VLSTADLAILATSASYIHRRATKELLVLRHQGRLKGIYVCSPCSCPKKKDAPYCLTANVPIFYTSRAYNQRRLDVSACGFNFRVCHPDLVGDPHRSNGVGRHLMKREDRKA